MSQAFVQSKYAVASKGLQRTFNRVNSITSNSQFLSSKITTSSNNHVNTTTHRSFSSAKKIANAEYKKMDIASQAEHNARSQPTRVEYRMEKMVEATEARIETLAKQVPEHFLSCRGCGADFQTEEEDMSGYVPRHHLHTFLERTKLELEAAKQDLRIRSGGGKGQGTAVAALHASMKSSLLEAYEQRQRKTGKGAFTVERLHAMGLDPDFNPLPRVPEYDEQGNLIHVEEPEEVPEVINQAAADYNRLQTKRDLRNKLNDPDADINEINALSKKRYSPIMSPDLVKKDQVLDKRDVNMLEKAAKLAAKPLRCMRCHQLANNAVATGAVAAVRAEDFVELLHNEFMAKNGHSSVIIKIVDVFDFHGSFIPDFKKIAGGRNPIILAVNKQDLLPRGIGFNALYAWVKREAAKYNLHVHSINIISGKTGYGVDDMMRKALNLARGKNSDGAPANRNIYVVGTTNVGKSTLVNYLMRKHVIGTGMLSDSVGEDRDKFKSRLDSVFVDDESVQAIDNVTAEEIHPLTVDKTMRQDPDVNRIIADIDVKGIPEAALNAVIPTKYLIKHHQQLLIKHASTTTSPIPGTTLGITDFPIVERKRGGRNLKFKDTPGVLNAHQLSSYLHYDELRAVLPTRQLVPHSYTVKAGQSLLFGALARVDLVSGRPFNIACFTAPKVTIQIASTHNITKEYLDENMGVMLMPPYDPHGRTDALNIHETIAVTPEESVALKIMQDIAKEEMSVSMQRANQRMGNNPHLKLKGDEQKEAIELSLDAPRTGRDRAAHLRAEGKQAVSNALDKLAPLETKVDTTYPARSFIDAKGRIVYQLQGAGWREASHDIVIAGLGWISVTGSGPITLRVTIAGEKFDLTEDEMAQTAFASQGGADGDIGNLSSNLPSPVRRAYMRTACRDPLLPWVGNIVEKWVGTPAALKYPLTQDMELRRDALRDEKEAQRSIKREAKEQENKRKLEEAGLGDYAEDGISLVNLQYPNPEVAARNKFIKPKNIYPVVNPLTPGEVETAFDVFATPAPIAPREPKLVDKDEEWNEIVKYRQSRISHLLDDKPEVEGWSEMFNRDRTTPEISRKEKDRIKKEKEDRLAEVALTRIKQQHAAGQVNEEVDVEFDNEDLDEEEMDYDSDFLNDSDFEIDEAALAAMFGSEAQVAKHGAGSIKPKSDKSKHIKTESTSYADQFDEIEDGDYVEEMSDMSDYEGQYNEYDSDVDLDEMDGEFSEMDGDFDLENDPVWKDIMKYQTEAGLVPDATNQAQSIVDKKGKKEKKSPRIPYDDMGDIPFFDKGNKFEKPSKKNEKWQKYGHISQEDILLDQASKPRKLSPKSMDFIRNAGSALPVPGKEHLSYKPTKQMKNIPPPPELDIDMVSAEDFDELERIQAEFELEIATQKKKKKAARDATPSSPFVDYHESGENTISVPTGPGGKKEKGGRRARKAMGLIDEPDRYAEAKYIEKSSTLRQTSVKKGVDQVVKKREESNKD